MSNKMSKRILLYAFLIYFKINFISCEEDDESKGGFRILDGDPANKEEWPFIVVVTCGEIHHCGGCLIKSNWVLTAGHCATGPLVKMQKNCLGPLSVRVGPDDLTYVNLTNYLNSNCANYSMGRILHSAVDSGTAIEVVEVVTYPKHFLKQFKAGDAPAEVVAYDLALLKLSKPVTSVPVKLATKSIFEASNCKVGGWGLRGNEAEVPGSKNDLQAINITVLDRKTCKELVESIFPLVPENLTEEVKKAAVQNVVCGDGETAITTILAGDSGGPLICDGELHGVVSLSLLKEDKNKHLSFSGVFAEVRSYSDWISGTANLSKGPESLFKILDQLTSAIPKSDGTSNVFRNKNYKIFYNFLLLVFVTNIKIIFLS